METILLTMGIIIIFTFLSVNYKSYSISKKRKYLINLYENNQNDEVIKICKIILKEFPDSCFYSYYLGLAYYRNNNKEKALNSLQHVIKFFDTNFQSLTDKDREDINFEIARKYLANIYLALKKDKDALGEFLYLSKQFHDKHLYHIECAKIYQNLNKIDDAVFYYNKALAVNNSSKEANLNLADIEYKRNNFELAKRFLLNYASKYDSDVNIDYKIAKCYQKTSDSNRAIEYYKKVLQNLSSEKHKKKCLYNYAKCLKNLNENDKSIVFYIKSLKYINKNNKDAVLDNDLKDIYINIVDYYLDKYNIDKSIEYLEEFLNKLSEDDKVYERYNYAFKVLKEISHLEYTKFFFSLTDDSFKDFSKLFIKTKTYYIKDTVEFSKNELFFMVNIGEKDLNRKDDAFFFSRNLNKFDDNNLKSINNHINREEIKGELNIYILSNTNIINEELIGIFTIIRDKNKFEKELKELFLKDIFEEFEQKYKEIDINKIYNEELDIEKEDENYSNSELLNDKKPLNELDLI